MLHSYLLSSLLTLTLTYSWYSFYGVQYFRKTKLTNEDVVKKMRPKPSREIPGYMWDIYKNGVNASEIDVVKGVFPKFMGASLKSRTYRNHRRKELEFVIPEAKEDEILVRSEVRIIVEDLKNLNAYLQIYMKGSKWIFLDEKKISNDENWISLKVTPRKKKLAPGSVTFMILTIYCSFERKTVRDPSLRPILLLSYFTKRKLDKNDLYARRKRSLESEDYEEKTNRIWVDDDFSQKFLQVPKRLRSGCRRKPLYIKFSDIDYDSWIVAPAGYEAFQCVGRCTFPVGEHLSPTKHAILQTLLHNMWPSKASRACCVPTRLEPISILYLDGNGVLTYRFRYPDMVVAECGCR